MGRCLSGRIAACVAAVVFACLAVNALAAAASDKPPPLADARRIVSIGGAVTEILYALGLEDRIVAVDATSLYPPRALKEKPNVGYMRQLSSEGILGLAPSGIIATEGSGPKETISVLEAAGVPLVIVPDRFTADGVLERIRVVAQAVGAGARGACLLDSVRSELAALEAVRSRVARPARVIFVMSFVNERPLVAGSDTAAEGIIALAGATNAVTGFHGYKLLTDEAVIAAAPDAVLVMQRPQQALAAEAVFARPAFATTPAAAQRRFVSMDGLYLLGFGPRTARAARDLAAALYPRTVGAAPPAERGDVGTGLDACR
jgi:iron complex transport system substrate-binding protein